MKYNITSSVNKKQATVGTIGGKIKFSTRFSSSHYDALVTIEEENEQN